MNNREQLGQLIRQHREDKKLSREELAEKCGLTDKCIGNIELEMSDPKFSTVMKIFAILEIDTIQLNHIVYTYKKDNSSNKE